MKGLIIKDFEYLKTRLGSFICFNLFSILIAVTSKDMLIHLMMVSFIMPLYIVDGAISDEKSNWTITALLSPLDRKDIVIEKYMYVNILNGLGILVCIILYLIFKLYYGVVYSPIDKVNLILIIFAFFHIQSNYLPKLFTNSPEKASKSYAIGGIIYILLIRKSNIFMFVETLILKYWYLIIIAGILLYIESMRESIKNLEKREF